MTYMNQLMYKPEKGAIFVVFETHNEKTITRRFDPDNESLYAYPVFVDGPSWSDAAGNVYSGTGHEMLIKFDGKRFRTIR